LLATLANTFYSLYTFFGRGGVKGRVIKLSLDIPFFATLQTFTLKILKMQTHLCRQLIKNKELFFSAVKAEYCYH
jgi:hypothetical protein